MARLDWNAHKEEIRQLYVEDGRSRDEVLKILKERNFSPGYVIALMARTGHLTRDRWRLLGGHPHFCSGGISFTPGAPPLPDYRP
jgi:hypothetical protein